MGIEAKRIHPLRGEVAQAFYSRFDIGFNSLMGKEEEQERVKEDFKSAVLSNPDITMNDVVDFLAEHGVTWSIDRSNHYSEIIGTF